jgi:hypothetical protein
MRLLLANRTRFMILAFAPLLFAAALAPATKGLSAPRNAAFAAAQDEIGSAADRDSLRKAEEHWLQFEDDPDALESILAADFLHALPAGFISKQDQIAYYRKLAKPASPPEKHFEDFRVRVYGDVGIANGIVVHTDANGSIRKTVFTDVFVRRGGKWLAVNSQENPYSPQPAPR